MRQKILIIDDEADERELMRRALEAEGYDIVEADCGEAGVAKAGDERPDIIITDTKMTGIDGFETCRKIKEIKDLDAQVIICTGAVDAVDAGKAREMGADNYCVKTIGYDVLLAAVKEVS